MYIISNSSKKSRIKRKIVAICEREGFIERYPTDIPKDTVDKTLSDMNNYVYKLVTQDLGFGQQIEDALKKIQIQKEMNENADDYELEDEDYADYYEDSAEQKAKDMKTMYGEDED